MTIRTEADELQTEAVRLALRWSRSHCRESSAGKPDCAWYHGFWQMPRMLGVGRMTGGQADFVSAVLREHARDPALRRVLVSGTADQAIPALIYQAYEAAGINVELTVLDWCETPLALCRWYAERAKRRVRTVCADVLAPHEMGEFDLVLSNSFLSRA